MIKGKEAKDLKAEGKKKCELTLDQINEVNLKLDFAIATLDLIQNTENIDELQPYSIATLASVARERLEEIVNILNPEHKD